MAEIGKMLLVFGLIFCILGIFFLIFPKIPYLGKLPGDILIKKENFTFFFPLTSSLLVSLVISLILIILQNLRR